MSIGGFTIEAKENYPADVAAAIDGGAFDNGTYTQQYLIGLGYDAVNRDLLWLGAIWDGFTAAATNTTGFTLWDGLASLGPGDAYDQISQRTLYIFRKNLDTGVVTATSTYSASKLVPNGIDGSDGTWRRFVSDILYDSNYSFLCDPQTGDLWPHVESCNLYVFRASDGFAQAISPLRPVLDANNAVRPLAMSSDWVFCEETILSTGTPATPNPFYVTPRLQTAAETSADELLAYASYAMPFGSGRGYYATCVDRDGAFWCFGNTILLSMVAETYTLSKFTPPALGAYPATGGGWSDVTPWAIGTGPNVVRATYTGGAVDKWNRNILMQLPDQDSLVAISFNYPADASGSSDPSLFRMDVTYIDTSDMSLVTHENVVTGWMTADWTPAATIDDAAWEIASTDTVNGCSFQVDPWLDQYSYDFTGDVDGLDYRDRWLWFVATPVVAGVLGDDKQLVMVQYRFDPGGAPTILKLLPEDGWDDAYPDFATALGNPRVVYQSLLLSTNLDFHYGRDKFVFDRTNNAFWLSGQPTVDFDFPQESPLWQFDPAFTPRSLYEDPNDNPGAAPPLMRLSFRDIVRNHRSAFMSSRIGAAL